MVHPFLLLVPFLAKNATVFNAVAAAELYGYARVYRYTLGKGGSYTSHHIDLFSK
jgi:hypothetical protein